MPEFMKKKVYFSIHAYHHKHFEQQAVTTYMLVHWYARGQALGAVKDILSSWL